MYIVKHFISSVHNIVERTTEEEWARVFGWVAVERRIKTIFFLDSSQNPWLKGHWQKWWRCGVTDEDGDRSLVTESSLFDGCGAFVLNIQWTGCTKSKTRHVAFVRLKKFCYSSPVVIGGHLLRISCRWCARFAEKNTVLSPSSFRLRRRVLTLSGRSFS